jgi:leucine dehydrogenase
MTVIKQIEERGHEQLVYFHYPRVGLKAIIGIHNTVLGPALGGCRMRIYHDEAQALDDVLRLSEGMTYKSAIAGLDLGGGKSCIIADPAMSEGRRELFLQFGKCLNDLSGRYITAEDMGTSVEDITVVRSVTRYASGYASEEGGSGDPSPWTAKGVFRAILAACERVYGSEDLRGRKIALQGAGHVGTYLLELLKERGASLIVSDPSEKSLEHARKEFGAEIVGLDQIYDVEADIYAPCAVGQTVNQITVPRLKCKIIAGAANNQISDQSVYKLIDEKGILYCPDFVINSGGVISVGAEFIEGGWNSAWVEAKIEKITAITHKVLDESQKRKLFPEVTATELARERIKAAEEKKLAGKQSVEHAF